MKASRTHDRQEQRQEKAQSIMFTDLSNLAQHNLTSAAGPHVTASLAFDEAFGGGLLRRVQAAIRGGRRALRSLDCTVARGSAGSRAQKYC